jgi:hypothetical protein
VDIAELQAAAGQLQAAAGQLQDGCKCHKSLRQLLRHQPKVPSPNRHVYDRNIRGVEQMLCYLLKWLKILEVSS